MELEDIKKLRPEERIKRLKELEEKRKEEIEKAEELIRSSEHELRVEEELRDIPIPQVKAVNIEQLFGAEERQVFRAKRFVPEEAPEIAPAAPETRREEERTLEETLSRESPGEAGAGPVYGLSSERVKQNLEKLYEVIQDNVRDQMRRLREKAAGGLTSEEEREIDYRMSQIERAAQSQQYAGEEARREFEEARTLVEQINMYKRSTGL